MKIAVSGTHCTGKTTLVEELHLALPGYVTVAEPYCLLLEEGHEFAAMPGLEDFEMQLERSIQLICDGDANTVFDRCPADFLAYLTTHRDSSEWDVQMWLARCQDAMEELDLVVYVPVEDPDRIASADLEDVDLRDQVDEKLREALCGSSGFGADAVEVTGAVSERLRQVLAYIGAARP